IAAPRCPAGFERFLDGRPVFLVDKLAEADTLLADTEHIAASERSHGVAIDELGDSLLTEPCTICGELAPQVQHFYSAGLVVRVHATCDAVWKQERGAPAV